MKTMIFMLAVAFAIGCVAQDDATSSRGQKIGTCINDPIVAGGEPGVVQNCNDTNYVQYTADWVTSAGVSPTPPITCNYYPGFHTLDTGEWVPAHNECHTNSFWGYNETGLWLFWHITCLIWVTPDGTHINICTFEPTP